MLQATLMATHLLLTLNSKICHLVVTLSGFQSIYPTQPLTTNQVLFGSKKKSTLMKAGASIITTHKRIHSSTKLGYVMMQLLILANFSQLRSKVTATTSCRKQVVPALNTDSLQLIWSMSSGG